MAKQQSFVDKVGKKKGTGKNYIKVIRTRRSTKSGALRFSEEMVCVSAENNADIVVKELLAKEA